MIRRLLVYALLIAGSLVFAWPFIWMVGTSVKLERELFGNRLSVLPQRPIPRAKSPYLDDRIIGDVSGPNRDEAIAMIEGQLRSQAWPSEIDGNIAIKQTARGIDQRLLASLPYEPCSESIHEL